MSVFLIEKSPERNDSERKDDITLFSSIKKIFNTFLARFCKKCAPTFHFVWWVGGWLVTKLKWLQLLN
jgi:hypothetical protein